MITTRPNELDHIRLSGHNLAFVTVPALYRSSLTAFHFIFASEIRQKLNEIKGMRDYCMHILLLGAFDDGNALNCFFYSETLLKYTGDGHVWDIFTNSEQISGLKMSLKPSLSLPPFWLLLFSSPLSLSAHGSVNA